MVRAKRLPALSTEHIGVNLGCSGVETTGALQEARVGSVWVQFEVSAFSVSTSPGKCSCAVL